MKPNGGIFQVRIEPGGMTITIRECKAKFAMPMQPLPKAEPKRRLTRAQRAVIPDIIAEYF